LGEDLRNALLSLAKQKPEQARTFILMYVGYTAREIADAFRIQINTVLSQKQYAKGWLIRMLKEYK
jgi:DNA-directed RNA polymerase specialized sigma24 family protein